MRVDEKRKEEMLNPNKSLFTLSLFLISLSVCHIHIPFLCWNLRTLLDVSRGVLAISTKMTYRLVYTSKMPRRASNYKIDGQKSCQLQYCTVSILRMQTKHPLRLPHCRVLQSSSKLIFIRTAIFRDLSKVIWCNFVLHSAQDKWVEANI